MLRAQKGKERDLLQASDYVPHNLSIKMHHKSSMLNALRKHKVHIFIFPLSIVDNLLMHLFLFFYIFE